MTKDETLRLALEALEKTQSALARCMGPHKSEEGDRHRALAYSRTTITAIKAALEAKDEKANDELRRLHDLLGKANALARIRANKIDELEQRLTKTEAQLGEAVWNYGELKREQLANQQKTSGSPINTSTALEAKDEPVAWRYDQAKYRTNDLRGRQWAFNVFSQARPYMDEMVQNVTPLYTTPPQRKPLTELEAETLFDNCGGKWNGDHWVIKDADLHDFARAIEAAHGIKGEAK